MAKPPVKRKSLALSSHVATRIRTLSTYDSGIYYVEWEDGTYDGSLQKAWRLAKRICDDESTFPKAYNEPAYRESRCEIVFEEVRVRGNCNSIALVAPQRDRTDLLNEYAVIQALVENSTSEISGAYNGQSFLIVNANVPYRESTGFGGKDLTEISRSFVYDATLGTFKKKKPVPVEQR